MQINLKSNIEQFTKHINYKYKEQVPYITSKTLNNLATKGRDEVRKQIPGIFDNKKTWWLNRDTGVLRKNSSKFNLTAIIYTGNKNYFAEIQETGGIKKPIKNKYITVPFKENIPRNRLKSGSARKYLNQKNVFIKNNLILQRKHKNNVVGLYRLVKTTKLKPRFHFYDICNGIVNSNLQKTFYSYLNEILK